MSFTTTYKRLAAVNILHAWYLDTEEQAFYGLSAEDQDAVLTTQLQTGRYSLMQDLIVEPSPATAALLKGHKMLFRQTAQGLLLGVAVQREQSNGQLRYRPMITPDNTLRLQFHLRIKDALLLSRSNLRFNPVFPACYYFTNDDAITGKTFPSLSAPMQNLAAGRMYEMGETAIVNGIASQAQQRTDTVTGWNALEDRQYISEYDRILLPFRFSYQFENAGITDASFVLKQGDTVVKTIQQQSPEGLQDVLLDFHLKQDNTPLENGFYTLTIAGNNGYERAYIVHLNNSLYRPGIWGVIDLVIQPADNAFRLIDEEGLLVAPAHPVFELRFLNRSAYLKYYFQQKEPPVADADWNELPAPAGMQKVIISKQPFPLMRAFRKINYDTVQLPNPDGRQISRENGLICADIMLTRIKL